MLLVELFSCYCVYYIVQCTSKAIQYIVEFTIMLVFHKNPTCLGEN